VRQLAELVSDVFGRWHLRMVIIPQVGLGRKVEDFRWAQGVLGTPSPRPSPTEGEGGEGLRVWTAARADSSWRGDICRMCRRCISDV
jgi:hypothetical protein